MRDGIKSSMSFSELVEAVLNGTFPKGEDVLVREETPFILRQVGFRNLKMLTAQRHIKNALRTKTKNNSHLHGLSSNIINGLPDSIENPVMIFDSLTRSNSIVVVTDKMDGDNLPIIVSVKADGKGLFNRIEFDANYITGFYGKDNFENFLTRNLDAGKVLYWDKEKSLGLLDTMRLQLPQALTSLSFDTIIRKSQAFVNNSEQENLENFENSKDDEGHARAVPGESKENTNKKEERNMDIPMTDEQRITAEARERARRLAEETGEPYITIEWSESAEFSSGDVLSLTDADKKLAALDAGFTRGGYDKVKLHIDYIKDGAAGSYENCRFDIGTEKQGLVGHIQSYWDFFLNNPRKFRRNDKELTGTSGPTESDYAYMANDLAPYFKRHRELSDMVTKAEGMGLTAEEIEEVKAFVRQSRLELNGVPQSAAVLEEEEHKENLIDRFAEPNSAEPREHVFRYAKFK